MASVPYGDSFLLVGGLDSDGYTNKILEYAPDSESWITREETIPRNQTSMAVALVEDRIVDCI